MERHNYGLRFTRLDENKRFGKSRHWQNWAYKTQDKDKRNK